MLVGWLVGFFFINVDLAIFQSYLDLEAGDNQSLKIQVARRGIEPRSSCSASQELNHSATAAPNLNNVVLRMMVGMVPFMKHSVSFSFKIVNRISIDIISMKEIITSACI